MFTSMQAMCSAGLSAATERTSGLLKCRNGLFTTVLTTELAALCSNILNLQAENLSIVAMKEGRPCEQTKTYFFRTVYSV